MLERCQQRQQRFPLLLLLLRVVLLAGLAAAACPFGFSSSSRYAAAAADETPFAAGGSIRGRRRQLQGVTDAVVDKVRPIKHTALGHIYFAYELTFRPIDPHPIVGHPGAQGARKQ